MGPVDPDIFLLEGLFNREINASKTYSRRGMHAAWAKIAILFTTLPYSSSKFHSWYTNAT